MEKYLYVVLVVSVADMREVSEWVCVCERACKALRYGAQYATVIFVRKPYACWTLARVFIIYSSVYTVYMPNSRIVTRLWNVNCSAHFSHLLAL